MKKIYQRKEEGNDCTHQVVTLKLYMNNVYNMKICVCVLVQTLKLMESEKCNGKGNRTSVNCIWLLTLHVNCTHPKMVKNKCVL